MASRHEGRYRSAMTRNLTPDGTVYAPRGMVCSVDHLASSAGVALLRAGGSAADAAIGDQRGAGRHHPAHVRDGRRSVRAGPHGGSTPAALAAVGAAGLGRRCRGDARRGADRDADARRRAVGDGSRLRGRLAGTARAVRPAAAGPGAGAGPRTMPTTASRHRRCWRGPLAGSPGRWPARTTTCRPAACTPATASAGRWWHDALDAIVRDGRDGFYGGAFGAGLLELGGGLVHRRPICEQPLAQLGRSAAVTGVGSGDLDRAAAVAGLPGAGRRPDRRTDSTCPTTRMTRPGRTCCPKPPAGRATTGTRCCSTAPTAAR